MKYVACLLCLLFLLSCKKPNLQTNEITKVELARSGAWSDFGATISVDSSLAYKYYGDYGKVKQGYFIGKASLQFWDTLNERLEYIKYKTLPVTDHATTQDANYFELIIHWKNGERHISRVWTHCCPVKIRIDKKGLNCLIHWGLLHFSKNKAPCF